MVWVAEHQFWVSRPLDAFLFGLAEGFRVEVAAALALILLRLERMIQHHGIRLLMLNRVLIAMSLR